VQADQTLNDELDESECGVKTRVDDRVSMTVHVQVGRLVVGVRQLKRVCGRQRRTCWTAIIGCRPTTPVKCELCDIADRKKGKIKWRYG